MESAWRVEKGTRRVVVGTCSQLKTFHYAWRTHYNLFMVLELQRSITVCPWLPLVVPSNH